MSLPGIVAAKCGAEIILTDNAAFPQCLDNCHRSCQMNNLSGVLVTGLTWGQISPGLLTLPPVDIILASDVFFEPEGMRSVDTVLMFIYCCVYFGESCRLNIKCTVTEKYSSIHELNSMF